MKAQILKRFEDEINSLERELHTQLPKEIQRAREFGDLRENAEYKAAKERQVFLNARIGQLKKRVAEISLINLDKIPYDKVAFGSTVELEGIEDRRQADVSARHAGRRGRREGLDFHGVADRPGAARQGRGRRSQGADAEWRARVRAAQAQDAAPTQEALTDDSSWSVRRRIPRVSEQPWS